jgi:hypothetical protein
MTNCWSEGALRAYLDRELSSADMKAVAAHLGECSACDALCAELAGRAARVFALLETLPALEETIRTRPAPSRTPSRWLWPGAAVALAAGLAIASIAVQKKETAAPVALAREPIRTPQPVTPAETPVMQPVERETPLPKARPAMARVMPVKRPARQSMDYFVALDDQPIESGVIMRMAIQPGNAQADIVFDPAGRPRAIRLVNDKSR